LARGNRDGLRREHRGRGDTLTEFTGRFERPLAVDYDHILRFELEGQRHRRGIPHGEHLRRALTGLAIEFDDGGCERDRLCRGEGQVPERDQQRDTQQSH
jgi:hypothetical protein